MLKKFLTVLAFTLFFSAPAWADQNVKRYAVLPFEVHGPQEYAYLSKGIQSMLSSRLTHTGQTSPVPTGEVNQEIQEPPRSSAEAGEMLGRLNADFVVYGTASIVMISATWTYTQWATSSGNSIL